MTIQEEFDKVIEAHKRNVRINGFVPISELRKLRKTIVKETNKAFDLFEDSNAMSYGNVRILKGNLIGETK